jgi:hypothetical protein
MQTCLDLTWMDGESRDAIVVEATLHFLHYIKLDLERPREACDGCFRAVVRYRPR